MEEEKKEDLNEKKNLKKGSKLPLIVYIVFYLLICALCLYAKDMYFTFNKLSQVLLLIVVPLLFTFINFCVFLRHNVKALDDLEKDYYPELKTNSMEFGASLSGKTDKSDITSLVLYLAENRYLNLGTKKLEDGSITYDADAYGYQLPTTVTYETPSEDGYDIYLTLDKQVQIFLKTTFNGRKK